MKSVVKFSLALAVFFTAFVARANDAKLSVSVKEGSGKVISFAVIEAKDVHVSIYSKDGGMLFDEKLKSNDGRINRTYDLTAFPSGTYYLETETGTKVSRHQITIEGTTAAIAQNVSEVLKPVITKDKGIVSVNILNTDKKPVSIKMYDENNSELYAENFDGQSVAKKFDINSTVARTITLIMTYNDKTFVENISAR